MDATPADAVGRTVARMPPGPLVGDDVRGAAAEVQVAVTVDVRLCDLALQHLADALAYLC